MNKVTVQLLSSGNIVRKFKHKNKFYKVLKWIKDKSIGTKQAILNCPKMKEIKYHEQDNNPDIITVINPNRQFKKRQHEIWYEKTSPLSILNRRKFVNNQDGSFAQIEFV